MPSKTVFAEMFDQPVPPPAGDRTPDTSEERLTRDAATAPFVALSNPESVPMESELEALRFVVDAFETVRRALELEKTNDPLPAKEPLSLN